MKQAPDFELLDQDGNLRRLNDYSGQWVVLYFYPKDDTPGCTKEACGFRDAREAIADIGTAAVIGVSKDSVKSHKKFADKYGLTFTLLSDNTTQTAQDYGVWKPKKFMGHEYLGITRATFIIDPNGKVAKEYPSVDPKNHAAEIIRDLRTLQSQ